MTEEEFRAFLLQKGDSEEAISRILKELSIPAIQRFYRDVNKMVVSDEFAETVARQNRLKIVTIAGVHEGQAVPWEGIELLLGLDEQESGT